VFHGEVDTILVFKLDRISGKLVDGIQTLCQWLEHGVRLVSVTQGHDFSGTTGKLIASVLFSVSEMEQETRRERQAAGIAIAKEQGKYTGRQPGSTKANPSRAKQLRAQGLSAVEIATAMGVSRAAAYRYLR
jgi:DNA invertase Pin-like site-specific DNA recombinase